MFFGGGNPNGGGQPPFMFPGFGGGDFGGGAGQQGQFNPLEMLFAQAGAFGAPGQGAGPGGMFGGPGGFEMDPLLMQNFFGPDVANGFNMGGAAAAEQRTGAPPTGKSTLRSLPRVKVSGNDLEKNESSECSICLDALVLGEQALRIPCGHLYHEDCIYDWLKKSNECPVCRYELPTDDATYERGREERMAGRKIRLHYPELKGRSMGELKRLALFLKIDVSGCLEKSELVACITASSQVEMVESSDNVTSSSSLGLFDYATAPTRSSCCAAVPEESREGGYAGPASVEDSEAREKRCRRDFIGTTDAPSTTAVPAPSALPLAGQSVGQLRKTAKELNVSLDGCLEKDDIVQRIRAAPGYQTT